MRQNIKPETKVFFVYGIVFGAVGGILGNFFVSSFFRLIDDFLESNNLIQILGDLIIIKIGFDIIIFVFSALFLLFIVKILFKVLPKI